MGRFLSTDPVAPGAGNPFNFNRYGYANNNPVINVDPDGRCVDGLTCDSTVRSYGQWANANPKEADKLGRAIGLPGVVLMATPTVAAASLAVLSSPLTYLAFSPSTGADLDVIEALKAAEERQKAAELTEAIKAEAKSIEKRIEELLKEAEKKKLLEPQQPPSPPQLPKPPSPSPPTPTPTPTPPPPPVVSLVQPETHSNDEEFILGDQVSHEG